MISDKLVGPKVKLVLLKFLPSLFVEALSDSSETAIHMFDINHENPELVWTDDGREKLCSTVQKMMTLHFKEQVSPAIHAFCLAHILSLSLCLSLL